MKRALRILAVLTGLALALLGSMAVAAWLSSGNGSGSVAATTVNQADAPVASRVAATVDLSWAPTSLASGAAVTGYQVYRHDGSGSTLLCTTTSTSCVDTTPSATEVSYGVVATVGTAWHGPESALTSFTYDDVAPTTTAEVTPAPNGAGWNKAPGTVTVTLEAADTGSAHNAGVDHLSYTVDGGSPVVVDGASTSFPVSGEGTHTITYFAVDEAGNTEATKTLTVKIDPDAPVTTVVQDPTANSAGWNTGNVTLDFTATDSGTSGIKSVTVDGVETVGASASKTLSTEGTHTVSYFATDNADNVEGAKTATVRIDKTAPTASISPAGGSTWTNDNTVAITASDALSGIASTQYSVDGAALQNYTSPVMLADGTRSFRYVVTDAAGKVTDQTATIKVDSVVPTSSIASTTSSTWTITANDAAPSSGVSIEWWVDSGSHTTSGSPVVVPVSPGSHTIHWFAKDAAGNAQTEQSLAVNVTTFAITNRVSSPPQNTTTVSGTGTPGAAVTVYLCNGTQSSCGASGPSLNSKGPQSTTVAANGNWSVVFDKLSNGAATFTVQAVQSSPSATSGVLVFTTS